MNLLGIQKKIDEQKAKDWQEKLKVVSKDIEAVCKKHNVNIVVFLNYTPIGITPQWTIRPAEVKKNGKETKE